MALNDTQADPIFANMVAGRSYPQAMLVATAEQHAELRRRLP